VRAIGATALGSLGAGLILFAGANLLPSGILDRPGSAVPLAFLLLFLSVAVFAGGLIGRAIQRLGSRRVTREVEQSAGLADGELVGAVELGAVADVMGEGSAVRGVSPVLARLQRHRVGAVLAGRTDAQLAPESSTSVRRGLSRSLFIVALALAIAALSGMRGSARVGRTALALASPWSAAFPPPPPPLALVPGAGEVERGTMANVLVSAPARTAVAIVWRPEGELPRRLTVSVDPATDRATADIGPISSPSVYWAEDEFGASRDSFRVIPVDPLAVTSLRAEVSYPPHLGRPPDVLERPLPPLMVPVGTVIRLTGSANYPIASVGLSDGDHDLELATDAGGQSFAGDLTPVVDGTWTWRLVPATLVPSVRPPDPIEIRVQVDGLPDVRIAFPGRDTVVQAVRDLPLVVDATDDNGLRRLEVVSWRVSATGLRSETAVDVVGDSLGLRARVVVRPMLRLAERNLLPGDTIVYYARAHDGNPANLPGVSDTFRVRLPTLTELRAAAADESSGLAENAESLGEAARQLERAADEAGRRAGPASTEPPAEREADDPSSTFESTREGRRVLDRAKSLQSEVAGMRDRIAEFREQLESSALTDPDLQRQLAELERLYEEILESGLGERIEELRRAMESLDQADLQASLNRMANRMREIREQLEQGVALMERVAVEQGMKSAEEQAEDLARRQRAAAESPSREQNWADREQRMAAEADDLRSELHALRERLEQAGSDAAAEPTAAAEQSLSEASSTMREASRQARQESEDEGESSEAARASSSSAAGSMEEAADQLAAARKSLTEDWRQEAMAAVDRATSEALELAREQAALAALTKQSGPEVQAIAQGRQAAVRQGLENLMASLSEAGKKTALLDRRVGPAAARAADGMDSLLIRMGGSDGNGDDSGQSAGQLVEDLNEVAGRLLASRRQMESARSGTGMEEALEALSRMGQAQGGLNEDTGGLMSLQRAGETIAERISDLARRQAEIAEQLRELGEDPGAEQLSARPEELAEEAEEIARELAAGPLDPQTLARQERLFRRLLDAGRSMEKEEEDPERRESRTGGEIVRDPVTGLDEAILGGISFPHPDEEALRDVPPTYRPLIMDYFDRINRAFSATDPGGRRR
jgi:hypothetical protein